MTKEQAITLIDILKTKGVHFDIGLTDDEIGQMQGTYDELEGTLQKKYGYKKEI